jgi:phosphohistidine phosphatase SixA
MSIWLGNVGSGILVCVTRHEDDRDLRMLLPDPPGTPDRSFRRDDVGTARKGDGLVGSRLALQNRRMRGEGKILALVLTGMLALPGTAAASEELWTLLKGGGHVVLIRHAITTPGAGDPHGMRLDDCNTQRNLTDAGRQDARRLGEAFRTRGIVVDRVLSSPWCRCLETARLAFGAAELWRPLSNLYGRSENRAEQVRQMEAMVGERRTGGNLVLVSHGSTISALTGVAPSPAELVVVTPQGGGRFTVAGRLTAH